MRHRPRVIVLGSNAALRIRNGALDLEHGPAAERIKLKIDIDDPKPCAILFDGRGEFITGEAIRFCARYAIDIILPNGPGRAILFAESALEASDGAMLRDIGPAIIRAQCAANPVQVAREIVRAKIAADVEGFGPRLTERDFSTIARCEAKLASARSVAEMIVIEAKAASVYWRSHRDLGLIERSGGNLPRSWLRFANRGRGAEFLGNKHASHPISAMINYCIVVEAGRLARALSGFGLALQIGFLHADKHGRNSLVWDAIEPMRARINARVFAFIASHKFARSDFPAGGINTHRIAQRIVADLLARCLSPDQDILDCAAWMQDLVMRYGASRRATGQPLALARGNEPSAAIRSPTALLCDPESHRIASATR
jgi:CRISPR/Cas system-associated endonuclease Cas1